jgi:hypothetical protein
MSSGRPVQIEELRSKILKGIDLAVEKLIKSKVKQDSELVYSKEGQVFRIKARDLDK